MDSTDKLDNKYNMSQTDTEKTMPSASLPQHLENLNTPKEIDHAPLNFPTTTDPSVIIIRDSDSEDEDIIMTDLDYNERERNRKSLYRYNRRLKYKIRRAIDVILSKNRRKLPQKDIFFLEEIRNAMNCEKSNTVAENVVNLVSRVESKQPLSEEQNLRRIVMLRHRYLRAIRDSYNIMTTWLNYGIDLNRDSKNTVLEYLRWVYTFILNDNNDTLTLGLDGGELESKLDSFVQNKEFSDSESSCSESEISSDESEYPSPDGDTCHQSQPLKPNDTNTDLTYDQFIMNSQRKKLSQQLQNQFKKIHHKFYKGSFRFKILLQSEEGSDSSHNRPSTSMVDGVEPLRFYIQNINQETMVPLGSNTRSLISQITIMAQKITRYQNQFNFDLILNNDKPTSQIKSGSSTGSDDVCVSAVPQSCFNYELPYQRNSRRIAKTKSLSSETTTSSSHAITNNLLATSVIRDRLRSCSKTRNHSRTRRFCSLLPPSNRPRIISQAQIGPGSPTLPLVPITLRLSSLQLLRSPPATTTTNISASTVTTPGATAQRPDLSIGNIIPPVALKSTLRRVLADYSATATLSQVSLTLLKLSEQSPKSNYTNNTCLVDNRTYQTTATPTPSATAAATTAITDDSMSTGGVSTIDVGGGGGLAKNSAKKRQRSCDRRNSTFNVRKQKPSSSSNIEHQTNKE